MGVNRHTFRGFDVPEAERYVGLLLEDAVYELQLGVVPAAADPAHPYHQVRRVHHDRVLQPWHPLVRAPPPLGR